MSPNSFNLANGLGRNNSNAIGNILENRGGENTCKLILKSQYYFDAKPDKNVTKKQDTRQTNNSHEYKCKKNLNIILTNEIQQYWKC